MFRLLIAVIVGGCFLTFLGVQEFRLASGTKAEPQVITCAALERDGPGDNAYVELTGFALADDWVYQENKSGTKWVKVWAPAIALDGEYAAKMREAFAAHPDGDVPAAEVPVLARVDVIVRSDDVPDDAALQALGEQDSIRGLIVNRTESLGSEERKFLARSYPQADLDKVWILDAGRQPKGYAVSGAMTLGGLVLIGGGLFGVFGRFKK